MNNKKKKLQKELERLLKKRTKSQDRQFVMDSYGYESELRNAMGELN